MRVALPAGTILGIDFEHTVTSVLVQRSITMVVQDEIREAVEDVLNHSATRNLIPPKGTSEPLIEINFRRPRELLLCECVVDAAAHLFTCLGRRVRYLG
jgi:hypothetical protein